MFKMDERMIKKKVKKYILQKKPDDYLLLNNKILSSMIIYLTGFLDCFNLIYEEPINDNEVQKTLITQGIMFIEKSFLKS